MVRQAPVICVMAPPIHLDALMPYTKVTPGYFLSFEAFVPFAQAPDEGN